MCFLIVWNKKAATTVVQQPIDIATALQRKVGKSVTLEVILLLVIHRNENGVAETGQSDHSKD